MIYSIFALDSFAKNGARQNGYFKTLPEAKKWLADAKYEDTHNLIVTAPDMTVDKWFNYWIDNIICDLAPNTIRNYRERYERNIQPLIGQNMQAQQSGRPIFQWELCSNQQL